MNILTELQYYQKLTMLLEKCLKESPCDPDITEGQIKAHKRLNNFLENTTFIP